MKKNDLQIVAEKLMDTGNLALGTLVFSNLLLSTGIKIPHIIIGLIILCTSYFYAIVLLKGGKNL